MPTGQFGFAESKKHDIVLLTGRFVTDGRNAVAAGNTNTCFVLHVGEANDSDVKFGHAKNMAVGDEPAINHERSTSGHAIATPLDPYLSDSRPARCEYVLSWHYVLPTRDVGSDALFGC